MAASLLLLVSCVSVLVQAERPAVQYQYDDDLREDTDSPSSVIVHNDNNDNVWDAMRDEEAAFLRDAVTKTDDAELGSVVLTASPARLEDGEDLVVSWSGVARPHPTDFVGLSCGPQAHEADFLVKAGVTAAAGPDVADRERLQTVRFASLYMMRCNYSVEYFNFQPRANVYARLGKLQVGMTEAFTAPKHGHLSLTDEVDEMSVMFNSASREVPVVKYGLDAFALDQQAEGTSKTYTAAHLCSHPANRSSQQWFRDPGNIHRVVLKGLNGGTRYFYKFGSDNDGWSSVYSFMSRPDASVKSASLSRTLTWACIPHLRRFRRLCVRIKTLWTVVTTAFSCTLAISATPGAMHTYGTNSFTSLSHTPLECRIW